MQIDRSAFLKAVKFLLPAISKTNGHIMNWLHVKATEATCVLTAINGICGKRVIILRDLTLEDAILPEKQDREFLIPKSIVESFGTLCQRHKSRFSKKKDLSYALIEIYSTELKSHKNVISYSQPPVEKKFPEMDKYFEVSFWHDANPNDRSILANSKNIIDTLKGFDADIQIRFPGGKSPILIFEDKDDVSYLSFFLPKLKLNKNEEKDPEIDSNEQTTFD